jgi:hypothetical protein
VIQKLFVPERESVMRHHLGSLLRRPAVGVISPAANSATCGAAAAPPAREAERIGSTQCYRALRHGGAVRAANPADGVLNSSIIEPGRAQSRRVPAYANTLGYDSDVLALGRSIRQRGAGPDLRMTSRRDAAWTGVLFAAVDARPSRVSLLHHEGKRACNRQRHPRDRVSSMSPSPSTAEWPASSVI